MVILWMLLLIQSPQAVFCSSISNFPNPELYGIYIDFITSQGFQAQYSICCNTIAIRFDESWVNQEIGCPMSIYRQQQISQSKLWFSHSDETSKRIRTTRSGRTNFKFKVSDCKVVPMDSTPRLRASKVWSGPRMEEIFGPDMSRKLNCSKFDKIEVGTREKEKNNEGNPSSRLCNIDSELSQFPVWRVEILNPEMDNICNRVKRVSTRQRFIPSAAAGDLHAEVKNSRYETLLNCIHHTSDEEDHTRLEVWIQSLIKTRAPLCCISISCSVNPQAPGWGIVL